MKKTLIIGALLIMFISLAQAAPVKPVQDNSTKVDSLELKVAKALSEVNFAAAGTTKTMNVSQPVDDQKVLMEKLFKIYGRYTHKLFKKQRSENVDFLKRVIA